MKSIRERKQKREAVSVSPPSRQTRNRRSYWQRLMGFVLKSLIVIGILIGIVLLSFLIIWQIVQPSITVYEIGDTFEVEQITGQTRSGGTQAKALSFDGAILSGTQEKPAFGGLAGNVIAVRWAPIVAVANDKTPVVYRPQSNSANFVDELRKFPPLEQETTSDWVAFSDLLTGIAQWANDGTRAEFVPARLWASDRTKTVVLFCDLQPLYDPSRSGPDSDFVWHVDQQWANFAKQIKTTVPDVQLVVFFSHGPGMANLWSSSESEQTVFGQTLDTVLQEIESQRSVFDFLNPTKLSLIESKLKGQVLRLGNQLEFPQQPWRLSTLDAKGRMDKTETGKPADISTLYWGKIASNSLGLKRKNPVLATSDQLDAVWSKLNANEKRLLIESPDVYRDAVAKLLSIEQLWAWRLVPEAEKSSQFRNTLNSIEKSIEPTPALGAENHISLWDEFVHSLRGNDDYWSLLAGDNLNDVGQVAEWTKFCDRLLANAQEFNAETSDAVLQNVNQYVEQNVSNLEHFAFQENAYCWRLRHELLNSKQTALTPELLQAVAWSVLCRDRANFLAAIYNAGLIRPGFPLAADESMGLKSPTVQKLSANFEAFEKDRRLLEDLLFAYQNDVTPRLSEFSSEGLNKSALRQGSSGVSPLPNYKVAEALKELHGLYLEQIAFYQEAVKLEISERRRQIRSEFDHHFVWRETARDFFKSSTLDLNRENTAEIVDAPLAQSADDVRRASAELLTPWLSHGRNAWRKVLLEHKPTPGKESMDAFPDEQFVRLFGDTLAQGVTSKDFQAMTHLNWEDNPAPMQSARRAVLDRWETPKLGAPTPYYESAWNRSESAPIDAVPFSKIPLRVNNTDGDAITIEFHEENRAQLDSGLARVEQFTKVETVSSPSLSFYELYEDSRPETYKAKVGETLELEVYFRGWRSKKFVVDSPKPVDAPVDIIAEIKIETGDGTNPLVKYDETELQVTLDEFRNYNVVFLIDGSASMTMEWDLRDRTREGGDYIKKKPVDLLRTELKSFLQKYRKDARISGQFLLFSWQTPSAGVDWHSKELKGETVVGTPPLTVGFKENLWIFPREKPIGLNGKSDVEWEQFVDGLNFSGNTPLEYALKYSVQNLLRDSNNKEEWLLIVVSDGCDQLFPNPRIVAENKGQVRDFQNFVQSGVSDVILTNPRAPDVDVSKYKDRIYYYNFLHDAQIDFRSDNVPERTLAAIFDERLPEGGERIYPFDVLWKRIQSLRGSGFQMLEELADIRLVVDPQFELVLPQTDKTTLTHQNPASKLSLQRLRANTQHTLRIQPRNYGGSERGVSSNPAGLPVRGGERFVLRYSEQTNQLSYNERASTSWQQPGTTQDYQRHFSMVDGNALLGRPDFVFLHLQDDDAKNSVVLQDVVWRRAGLDNRIQARLPIPSEFDWKNSKIETFQVREELGQPIDIWEKRNCEFSANTKELRMSFENNKEWSVNGEAEDKVLKLTIQPQNPTTDLLDPNDEQQLRNWIIQVVDEKSGRIPAEWSPNKVERLFHYRNNQLEKIEVSFTYGKPVSEQDNLRWGFARLEDLDLYREN